MRRNVGGCLLLALVAATACSGPGAPTVEDLADTTYWMEADGEDLWEGTILIVPAGAAGARTAVRLGLHACTVPGRLVGEGGDLTVEVTRVEGGPGPCVEEVAVVADLLDGVDGWRWGRESDEVELRSGSETVVVLVPVDTAGHG